MHINLFYPFYCSYLDQFHAFFSFVTFLYASLSIYYPSSFVLEPAILTSLLFLSICFPSHLILSLQVARLCSAWAVSPTTRTTAQLSLSLTMETTLQTFSSQHLLLTWHLPLRRSRQLLVSPSRIDGHIPQQWQKFECLNKGRGSKSPSSV